MPTSQVIYAGELRTTSTHIASAETIITDAPVDNQGKGQAFSPTDMVANSLATCMLTIMAIKANSMGIELKGAQANVTKVMQADPRRISAIEIEFTMGVHVDERSKLILERSAITCPVYLSLHPEIEKNIQFTWL